MARPRGVRRAARCPGPPQPMRGGAGRNDAAGTATTYADVVPRRDAHPVPLGSTSRRPRSAWDDAIDRHRLASPTGRTSRLRHGQHVAPEAVHHKGLGSTETGGPTGRRGGSGPPVLITRADEGHGRPVGRGVRDRFRNAGPAPLRVHDVVVAPLRTSGERITPIFGRPRPPYANDPGVSIHRGRPSGPVARESVPTRFHAMPGTHFGHPVFPGSHPCPCRHRTRPGAGRTRQKYWSEKLSSTCPTPAWPG